MPAKSKVQQRLFGIARGIQKGTVNPSTVGEVARDIAENVSAKSVKDFASTKTKKLRERIGKRPIK